MEEKRKKPIWKRWWVWVLALIIIGALATGGDDDENLATDEQSPPAEDVQEEEPNNEEQAAPIGKDENQTDEQAAPNQDTKQEEKAPEELEMYLEYVINDVAGEKTNHDGEYEKRVHAVYPDPERNIVEVVADDNFSSNLIRTGILSDSTDIFKRVFSEREDVNSLLLTWQFPAQDKKGNEMRGILINIAMTKENADTINWDNFRYSNLPDVADTYAETPLFKSF
ncbi:hypothetical protein [Fredinandcohnia sp. 179-A 10B2 NHS]|uniref:hypothetical protein n=1 Tax=Fredinandcohnia sp. 179-A 10B2 NHS TaxID=3235176 RepID=UPI00399F9698